MDQFNSIDVLINNAAVFYPSDFMDITEEQWDKTMNINLRSTFLLKPEDSQDPGQTEIWLYY